MAGLIPREFIDQLLARCDIIDVINARVPLKKHGKEYQACCPFHNEKTPSFTVSSNKQFYHCFGCGANGSVINFLMEYEHLDFVEAIESLAATMGMEVPREEGKQRSPQQQQRTKGLIDLMQESSNYYQQQLKHSPIAIDYLKQRGLSGEIAQAYGIGYSKKSWDAVLNQLSGRYRQEQIIDSGLAIKNDEGRVYDRYRDRIMFPIHNRKGQVIGFGGRVMSPEDSPKYINSPETSLFHKSNELYGLYEARQAARKLERIVVVEGYLDVISLAQFGVTYAVATLGTATTTQHIELLYRTVPEIIFCFDGDRAGKDAAWKALANALPILKDDKEIRFMFLPDGEDPDSLIRRIGKEAYEALFIEATSLSAYFIEALGYQFNITTNEGKSRFLTKAIDLLKGVPDTLLKDQMIQDIARRTSVEKTIILKRLSGSNDRVSSSANRGSSYSRSVKHTPIVYACILLINTPALVNLVKDPEQIAFSGLPGTDLLAILVEYFEESPHINAITLLDRCRNSELEVELLRLMKWQSNTESEEMLALEFKDCLVAIENQSRERHIERLLHKAEGDGLSCQDKSDSTYLADQQRAISGLAISRLIESGAS